jgi:translation initiation factor 2B subunit (eIF-2B alpha/beta/delta family)
MSAPPPDSAARIAWIRQDRAHGASFLAREAADLLHTLALAGLASDASMSDGLAALHHAAQTLAAGRPSMVALANTAARIWAAAAQHPSSPHQALAAAEQTASALLASIATAAQHITHYARPLIADTILTKTGQKALCF